jgi:hypothetical protein
MENEKLYTQEDMERNYEIGRQVGNKENHAVFASKETKEIFNEMNLEFKTFKQSMEDFTKNIEKKIDEGFRLNTEEHSKIRDSQMRALETKADKQVVDDLKEISKTKADKEVVDEIRADLRKVVWIVLTGVILALLTLIMKA